MAVTNGGELREWRRSRGWDVPELARRLRRAADEPIAAHDGLVRMIRAWERGDHRPSERYELLYRRLPSASPGPARTIKPGYAELLSRLPGLLSQLDTACHRLTGDDRLRACALSADAYHVAAGFLLKTGDPGLAHVATDRSMTAALASQDPLTVGTSARIVTHTLMSSGHLTAAVTTAQNHTARLDRETETTTP
jgi:hypothetical protein